jgi:23S rRNA (cytidine1920-2'-O)/16S rRNA (cytidine1409-2'-O)-methyltransferase
VVHDPQQHQQVLWDVLTAAQECGLGVRATIASPLLGPKGNREFLAHLQFSAAAMSPQALQELCRCLALPPQTGA